VPRIASFSCENNPPPPKCSLLTWKTSETVLASPPSNLHTRGSPFLFPPQLFSLLWPCLGFFNGKGLAPSRGMSGFYQTSPPFELPKSKRFPSPFFRTLRSAPLHLSTFSFSSEIPLLSNSPAPRDIVFRFFLLWP